jgi:hypothetical protein
MTKINGNIRLKDKLAQIIPGKSSSPISEIK